ncbi:sodium/glutamate symporter [Rubritepida flocculans]|uniref:sodium/glutamate symporter n=1 Tax=Rubritepida flocculans TaxID=182403 RepID=UPI00040AA4FB|nr:sodium/glutamate symporter [Rubritepida flocculans]
MEGDALAGLGLAAGVLLLGRLLHARLPALAGWNIPEAVTGGLLLALAAWAAQALLGWSPPGNAALREPMLLAFFAAIGLSADLGSLRAGGPALARLGVLVALFILAQNLLGIGLALLLGLDPLIGLLAGSITLVGGHGTGAAFAALFESRHGLEGAREVALAAATLGIVLGGLLAGPSVRGLLPAGAARRGPASPPAPAPPAASAEAVTGALALVLLTVVGGAWIAARAAALPATLPDFLWPLFLGVLLRNLVLGPLGVAPEAAAMDLVQALALAFFLALAMAALRLGEVAALALPLLLIIAAQAALTIAFTRWLCFRALGGDAEAAVTSAGFCGFALGSTATALATMREMERAHGPMPQAILVVSLTAGLVTTLANAVILSALLALPLFAR